MKFLLACYFVRSFVVVFIKHALRTSSYYRYLLTLIFNRIILIMFSSLAVLIILIFKFIQFNIHTSLLKFVFEYFIKIKHNLGNTINY